MSAFCTISTALCTDLMSASDTNLELLKSSSSVVGSTAISFAASRLVTSGRDSTRLYVLFRLLISL